MGIAGMAQDTAAEAAVKLVTGDTKVVPRGAADKLFINTAGIGVIPEGVSIDRRSSTVG
jgi:hydrogenase expression/formation protein HypE